MSSLNDGRSSTWVRRKKEVNGGWSVWCVLCGKRFKRYFSVERSEGDPAKDAGMYIAAHLDSNAHAAAVAAYREPAQERITPEERMLRNIFDVPDPELSEEQMRRGAAKSAAEKVYFKEGGREGGSE